MQDVHPPLAQSARLVDARFAPRCSVHPGHARRRPHVQPEPAIDLTALRGGMVGKDGSVRDEPGADGERSKIGGRSGPGAAFWWLRMRLWRLCEGLAGEVLVRFEGITETAVSAVGRDEVEAAPPQHNAAARASVASPFDGGREAG